VTYRSEYATDLNIDVKMRKNCPEESEWRSKEVARKQFVLQFWRKLNNM
jgi:hypothetical protein